MSLTVRSHIFLVGYVPLEEQVCYRYPENSREIITLIIINLSKTQASLVRMLYIAKANNNNLKSIFYKHINHYIYHIYMNMWSCNTDKDFKHNLKYIHLFFKAKYGYKTQSSLQNDCTKYFSRYKCFRQQLSFPDFWTVMRWI